jgi:sugar phosphate isomerase/epimerase
MEHKLSRRKFIGAATAAGVAGGLGATTALGRALPGPVERLRIPLHNRGIILFAIRDTITRNPLTTGPGPNGETLPSGFQQVFQAIAGMGYKQVEFAGYTQNANSPGGPGATAVAGGVLNTANFLAWGNTLRGWLDANGLKANGTHAFIPNDISNTTTGNFNRDRFKLECEFAATLGMELYGTGGDVSGSRFKEDWKVAAERWNELGAIAKTYGLKLYTHNHDGVWNFILDRKPFDPVTGRPTRSSGVRMQEYGMQLLDDDKVYYEIDIYWAHVAQHRFQTYTDADGNPQTDVLDPAGIVARRRHRVVSFHAKDGRRLLDPVTGQPTPPGVGAGYQFVPFGASGGDGAASPPAAAAEEGIDFSTFYDRIGSAEHVSFWEQDNAPGSSATPAGRAQSLAFAKQSYDAMAALGAVGSSV